MSQKGNHNTSRKYFEFEDIKNTDSKTSRMQLKQNLEENLEPCVKEEQTLIS